MIERFYCPHTEDYRRAERGSAKAGPGSAPPCPVGCPMRRSRVCPLPKREPLFAVLPDDLDETERMIITWRRRRE